MEALETLFWKVHKLDSLCQTIASKSFNFLVQQSFYIKVFPQITIPTRRFHSSKSRVWSICSRWVNSSCLRSINALFEYLWALLLHVYLLNQVNLSTVFFVRFLLLFSFFKNSFIQYPNNNLLLAVLLTNWRCSISEHCSQIWVQTISLFNRFSSTWCTHKMEGLETFFW